MKSTKAHYKFRSLSKFAGLCLVIALVFSSCKRITEDTRSENPPPKNTFIDPRDGQVYAIVKIGEQWWFAENLNFEIRNNWSSWCYGNNPENCSKYGRLYDWQTANTVCPQGWHLPSDAEWNQLITFCGGEPFAGGKMKSKTGWNSPNLAATDSSGFSGLPGGVRRSDETFSGIGTVGTWWSSSESNTAGYAWVRSLYHNGGEVARGTAYSGLGLSCRCIRD